jgi:hypothetical protein
MCHAARCRTCGLVTWSGCGRHIAEVKAQIPPSQWCDGHPEAKVRPWWLR